MTNTVTVTLDQLHASPKNVRKKRGDVGSLAASILSVGLIYPMIVTPRMKGKKIDGYQVEAGERRRIALLALAEQYPERAGLTFACTLVDDASKVTEISLAENYAREQMTAPDIYLAFATIRAERPDATLEEMAAMFGFDTSRAARIMRLANLAPEIMALYSAGEIDDRQAQAYAATEDQALQLAVYRQLEETAKHSHQKDANAIRAAMKSGDREQTARMRYVGVDAYRAAGGGFEADLFAQAEGTGRVEHPDLLQRLVIERLAQDKDRFEHNISRNGRVLGEKWGLADLEFSWAEAPPQIKQYGYLQTDHELAIHHPKRGALAKDLQEVLESMQTRLGGMIGEDDEPLEGFEDQYETLSAEVEDLEAQRPIILPKKGAVVGIATIGSEGEFSVALWYADRAAKGALLPKGATGQSAVKAPLSPAEEERARFGLSKDNMQAMMLIRRDMIREELFHSAAGGSTLATDWLLFSQARTILHGTPGYGSKTHHSGERQGVADIADADDFPGKLLDLIANRPERAAWNARKEAMRAKPWASDTDPMAAFALFRVLEQADKDQAAALIAGHTLMATTSAYNDGRTPRMVCELANYIEQEPSFGRWRDGIELDEAFFATFSHKARVRLLEQWGAGDRAKGLKSSESAAFCARVVNCDEADAKLLGFHMDDVAEAVNWLPEFMETGTVAPLAEAAQADREYDDFPEQHEDEGEMSDAV